MPNDANVNALSRLLQEAQVPMPGGETATVLRPLDAGAIARFLAARGVLVPSALTDAQGYEIGCTNDFTIMRSPEREAIEAREVRTVLERIARGEG
jgi:myo-inositol-1-phosphate synthase